MVTHQRSVPPGDEQLARSMQVGSAAHRGIAALLNETIGQDPVGPLLITPRRALATADLMLGPPTMETRAHRQMVAGAICTYFRVLLPPSLWSVEACEVPFGAFRVDVLWRHRDGRVLLDELKTGRLRQGTRTHAQVQQYLTVGVSRFGPLLVGARVLCTGDPARSWLQLPSGLVTPLRQTPFLAVSQQVARRQPAGRA